MARPKKTQALDLWMNGEHVGQWRIGPNGTHELTYSPLWQASPRGRPLSLSLPFRPGGEPARGPAVKNYFDNLLPDSEQILERIQRRYSAPSTSAFDLLWEIGRDCVGAVQLLPEGSSPPAVRHFEGRRLRDDDVERILEEVPLSGRHLATEEFRISLAGAQEKTGLVSRNGHWYDPKGATPTTHIFKLPLGTSAFGVELTYSIENEWLCSRLLAELGFPVAQCAVHHFGKQRALVVARFDRAPSEDERWIVRLPQEDCAQATATPPAQKYEDQGGPGIERLMNLLRGSSNAQLDRLDFFRSQVAFFLLAATDGHAKNFSLFLESGGGYHLTPRYDVISAYPVLGHGVNKTHERKLKMAMAVWGKSRHYHWWEIRRSHLERVAHDCGLAHSPVIIDELLGIVPDAVEAARKQLPRGFPTAIAKAIFDGVTEAAKRLQR